MELTLNNLKELLTSKAQGHPYEIGKNYQIRTVTMTLTGRLVAVHENELVIDSAAWIADTGRFADACKTGSYSEVEPFPDGPVIVGRGSIVDVVAIGFVLPRSQK